MSQRSGNIACLGESGWYALGEGLDSHWTFPGPVGGYVRAIVEDTDGSLVVCGDFEQVGTASISPIARAIGTTFYPARRGAQGARQRDPARRRGGIYAGGFFTGTGDYDEEAQMGAMIRGLACWNGFAWDEVGGIDGFVGELAWFDGKLLVVGPFELAGETGGQLARALGRQLTAVRRWGQDLPLPVGLGAAADERRRAGRRLLCLRRVRRPRDR